MSNVSSIPGLDDLSMIWCTFLPRHKTHTLKMLVLGPQAIGMIYDSNDSEVKFLEVRDSLYSRAL